MHIERLFVSLASAEPSIAIDALQKLVEVEADDSRIKDALCRREGHQLFQVFEVATEDTMVTNWATTRLSAIKIILPALNEGKLDDLELVGVLTWALDDIAFREPALAAAARDLRLEVLKPFNLPQKAAVDELEWRAIPGGTFTMGSPEGMGDADERPAHEVIISSFDMLGHEVTVEEYRQLVPDHPGEPDEPVVNVTWYEAYAYAAWLGGRLPTEAEWEYAARAGCEFVYCDTEGNEVPSDMVVWYSINSGGELQSVCKKVPNQFGLCDMYGNAWEWVADWFGAYSATPIANPWGPSSGDWRVIRGGSFSSAADRSRAAYRNRWSPWGVDLSLGFRVVRLLPP